MMNGFWDCNWLMNRFILKYLYVQDEMVSVRVMTFSWGAGWCGESSSWEKVYPIEKPTNSRLKSAIKTFTGHNCNNRCKIKKNFLPPKQLITHLGFSILPDKRAIVQITLMHNIKIELNNDVQCMTS